MAQRAQTKKAKVNRATMPKHKTPQAKSIVRWVRLPMYPLTNKSLNGAIFNMAKAENKSQYQINVLDVNSDYKAKRLTQCKTLGYAIKMLFDMDTKMPHDVEFALKYIKSDNDAYKTFDKAVRRNKNNTTTPFYVLQKLNQWLKEGEIKLKEAKSEEAKLEKAA